LGYNPGPADGLMGSKTRNAIKAFQKDTNLPVDGQISDELMWHIDTKLNK
jgi:localization factor PodJL